MWGHPELHGTHSQEKTMTLCSMKRNTWTHSWKPVQRGYWPEDFYSYFTLKVLKDVLLLWLCVCVCEWSGCFCSCACVEVRDNLRSCFSPSMLRKSPAGFCKEQPQASPRASHLRLPLITESQLSRSPRLYLGFYSFCVDSRDWAQVARHSRQVPLPVEPPHCPALFSFFFCWHCIVSYTAHWLWFSLP